MAQADRDLVAYAAAVATALERVPLITGVDYYIDRAVVYLEEEATNVAVVQNATDGTYFVEVV